MTIQHKLPKSANGVHDAADKIYLLNITSRPERVSFGVMPLIRRTVSMVKHTAAHEEHEFSGVRHKFMLHYIPIGPYEGGISWSGIKKISIS